MSRRINIINNIDWITIGIYLLLVVAGWFCIYGAVYNMEEVPFWDTDYRYGKQLMWIGLSFVIALFLMLLDSKIYNYFAYHIYAILLLLLLVTIFVAPEIKGSRSWLVLGPISLQPAEFAKTGTALALAKFMSTYNFKLDNWKSLASVFLIIFIPFMMIILQNETGSALVYCSLLLVLYREGMPGIFLFMAFCLALIFIVSIRFGAEPIIAAFPDESYGLFLVILFSIFVQILLLLVYEKNHQVPRNILIGTLILFAVGVSVYKFADYPFKFTYLGYAVVVLITFYLIYNAISIRKGTYALIALFGIVAIGFSNLSETAFNRLLPHQQTRIKVTLGMENDPKKAGYNVNQSKIAIGSGGLTGKGFLNGTQTKLKYVPEQDTDFIFCTVGEEHGFIGSVMVLSLFLFLFLRLIYLAERQRSLFSRIYGYCVSCIVFFHLFVNIGMVLGLTPVIGIPLPFFSYGGSSLWGFTFLLFIFLRLDASRTEYFG